MAEVRLEDAPRKARDFFEKGFAAMERGSLDYAMDMFMLALDIEPRILHVRKYLRGAALKKAKDKNPNALTHILSSIAGLGTFMSVSGAIKKKPMEALKLAEKLMRADPLNLTFINLLGHAAVAAGMPEVAIQTLEIARDHYPKNVELLQWLGNLYIELKNTRDARLCFEEIYHLHPNDPKALKALKDSAALDTMQKGGWSDAGSYRDVIKDTKESGLLEQAAKAVKSKDDLDDLIRETKGKLQREPDNINYRRAACRLPDPRGTVRRSPERVAGGSADRRPRRSPARPEHQHGPRAEIRLRDRKTACGRRQRRRGDHEKGEGHIPVQRYS